MSDYPTLYKAFLDAGMTKTEAAAAVVVEYPSNSTTAVREERQEKREERERQHELALAIIGGDNLYFFL